MANTLFDYYNQKGQTLPNLQERGKMFESYGLGSASGYQGTAEQNTALLGRLSQPAAPASMPAPQAPAPAPITNPVDTAGLTTAGIKPPTLPTPSAPIIQNSFTDSLGQTLSTQRKSLEDAYKRQSDDLQKRITESEAKIQEFTNKQQNEVLPQIQQNLAPFREAKETSERERLKVEENYFANQSDIKEIETLYAQIQSEQKAIKELAAPAAIMSGKIANAKQDAIARIGALQAVMAARNNQISVAETLIDRSVAAIQADRDDQLTYYKTLADFYEGQKDSEGKKLIDLRDDQRNYIQSQISLLESDFASTQKAADYLKQLMLDPQTANTIAASGVKLNDSVETINSKLAAYSVKQQKRDVINEMAAKGYSYLATPSQAATYSQEQVVTVYDAQGNPMAFLKPKDPNAGNLGGLTTAQRTYLNQIQDNARQDPNIKEFPGIRASYETARSAAQKGDGGGDIVLMRMIAKITDPTTGVREEEFRTFEGAQSVLDKYGVTLTKRMWAGDRLTPEGRAQLLQHATDIYNQRRSAYDASYNFFNKQATDAELPDGSVMPRYYAPDQMGIVAQGILEAERQGYQPGDIITRLLSEDSPVRGQVLEAQRNQYSPEEIIQYLKKATSAGTTSSPSAMSKGGKEIVAGYDITSYATDPMHGTRVQQIYSSIPYINSAADADAYIRSVAPRSPLSGEDVISSARQFGVDPKLVLAIMQQDSTFGTAGKAVRTLNPGNVGNDDSGREVTMPSWRAGVDAVARNLSKRKLS